MRAPAERVSWLETQGGERAALYDGNRQSPTNGVFGQGRASRETDAPCRVNQLERARVAPGRDPAGKVSGNRTSAGIATERGGHRSGAPRNPGEVPGEADAGGADRPANRSARPVLRARRAERRAKLAKLRANRAANRARRPETWAKPALNWARCARRRAKPAETRAKRPENWAKPAETWARPPDNRARRAETWANCAVNGAKPPEIQADRAVTAANRAEFSAKRPVPAAPGPARPATRPVESGMAASPPEKRTTAAPTPGRSIGGGVHRPRRADRYPLAPCGDSLTMGGNIADSFGNVADFR